MPCNFFAEGKCFSEFLLGVSESEVQIQVNKSKIKKNRHGAENLQAGEQIF